eukprot:scaffold17801_cov63-Phaeocystis_antarctica.AAC.6
MRAAAPTRAHTHAHATRTARLCTLPPSFLADAHHLASRCGGCPLVLRHTRARRPRPLRASAPKRELARPKGRSPVNAADSRARRLLLVCDNSRCAARSQLQSPQYCTPHNGDAPHIEHRTAPFCECPTTNPQTRNHQLEDEKHTRSMQ